MNAKGGKEKRTADEHRSTQISNRKVTREDLENLYAYVGVNLLSELFSLSSRQFARIRGFGNIISGSHRYVRFR
jgi:hypothetical protein